MKRLLLFTWIAILMGASCAVLAFAGYKLAHLHQIRSVTGVVLRQDRDPGKQLPIDGVQVTLQDETASKTARSGASGLFHLDLARGVSRGRSVVFELRHPDYQPLDIPEVLSDRLYVIRMAPRERRAPAAGPVVTISDIRVRYSVRIPRTTNIGSAVKTFTVASQGDVPCGVPGPCSPDGKWKAAVGEASLDAGLGNVLEHARVTCIAGPCPFTSIDKDSYSEGGRLVTARVLDWSDTATFVLAAEVMQSRVADVVLQTYPVIFEQAVSFTLPPSAQGPSIEATADGQDMVYPLGPALILSWADCSIQAVPASSSKLYRCVVKPGYRLQ